MKVLHIISDWKWTGASEPTVSSCEALLGEGLEIKLAFRKPPISFNERTIESEVKRRKIPHTIELKLNKSFAIRDWIKDLRTLSDLIKREGFEIVHSHLSHDHYIAFLARILSQKKPILVRTDHTRDGLDNDPFLSFVMRRTDGIVSYSKRLAKKIIEKFRLEEDRVCIVPPGTKLEVGELKDIRAELGLRPEEKIVGVVGRLKYDRHYDLILRAFRKVVEKSMNSKLLILGRSSQMEKSVIEPIKKLGIRDHVLIAGYRIDDYYSYISTFDVFIMMRAGSDGTARALREAMALGKPAIVGDTGMLGELVIDGETGFVVPLEEDALAQRVLALLKDDSLRKLMGEKAKSYAISHWNYGTQAKMLKDFYQRLLDSKS